MHIGILKPKMNAYLIGMSSASVLFTEEIFAESARRGLTQAVDLFRPVVDASQGADDWVSREASPLPARIADRHACAAAQLTLNTRLAVS